MAFFNFSKADSNSGISAPVKLIPDTPPMLLTVSLLSFTSTILFLSLAISCWSCALSRSYVPTVSESSCSRDSRLVTWTKIDARCH